MTTNKHLGSATGVFTRVVDRCHGAVKNVFSYIDKSVAFLLAFVLCATQSWAAGDGSAGITEATSMITSYFDPAVNLIYAIGAVVGLIGAVQVYSKFSSGDPDTSKTAAAWFGACIFLVVGATILRSFFL